MHNKIAVIGDKDSVMIFKVLGMDVFDIKNYFEGAELIKNLASEYKIIMITEEVAKEIEQIIARYKEKTYPIILPIPATTGNTGYGLDMLSKFVEKAVGIDILNIGKKRE